MIGALKRLFGQQPAAERTAPDPKPVPAEPGRERRDSVFKEAATQFHAGNLHEAARMFEECVELAHDDAEAHLNLGIARHRLGMREDAHDALTLALHFEPERPAVHLNLGVLALEAGEAEEAATYFAEAVRLDPAYGEAWSNLGLVQLQHLGRLDEAEASLQRALAARPGFPDALTNLGMLRHDQGRFEEAQALYDKALRGDSRMHEARLNRSLLYLARGEFARGWEEYEARRQASTHFVRRFERYPEWDGAPAPERTLLVYGEQGLGDQIMFASCLPEAIAETRHCVIDCSPKLAALFGRSFPAVTVHGGLQKEADLSWLERAPAIDLQIPMGSLPRFFRHSGAAFPRHAGYLKADPTAVGRWRERLAGLGSGLKVGISWRGGTSKTRRDSRSAALAELLPLLASPGARFVSLQYTDCTAEVASIAATHGTRIQHWQEALDDYDETAALVSALDLVICVQTAVAHLAGALGRPAWVMVPVVPEWRYLLKGERLPWYPSLRLFRQAEAGQWRPTVERIIPELAKLRDG
jgi:Flp pilus assembly protein TadD